jgi:hypothetical protein
MHPTDNFYKPDLVAGAGLGKLSVGSNSYRKTRPYKNLHTMFSNTMLHRLMAATDLDSILCNCLIFKGDFTGFISKN